MISYLDGHGVGIAKSKNNDEIMLTQQILVPPRSVFEKRIKSN